MHELCCLANHGRLESLPHFSMPTVPHTPRFWPPRFSLRTMFIVVTLLCLTVGPLIPELNRERETARQVKIIADMGGTCEFVDRPGNIATWLLRRIWPAKLEHLD